MRDDLIALKMVLDELEFPPDMRQFANRLKLQKAIYLIQLFGIDLGYRFSWYLRGPYSTDLTKDLFEIYTNEKEIENYSEKYNFEPRVKKRFRRWSFFNKPTSVDLPIEEWYELLASIHYLKHIAYTPNVKEKNFDVIYKSLSERKERFSKADAREGWALLDTVGLIKKQELPKRK